MVRGDLFAGSRVCSNKVLFLGSLVLVSLIIPTQGISYLHPFFTSRHETHINVYITYNLETNLIVKMNTNVYMP